MEEKAYIYVQMIYGQFKAHKIRKNKALKMLEGDNFILREDAFQVFIASTNEEFGGLGKLQFCPSVKVRR